MTTYQAMFIRQFRKNNTGDRSGPLVFRLVFNGYVANPNGLNKIFVVTLLPVGHSTGIEVHLGTADDLIGDASDYTVLIPILNLPRVIIDKAVALWKAQDECRTTFSSMSDFCFSEYRNIGYSSVSPKDVQLTISSGSSSKERVKS